MAAVTRTPVAYCLSASLHVAPCNAKQEDAKEVIRLKPDFKKGWFLLAKALWKDSGCIG